jgi:hypothetical protein
MYAIMAPRTAVPGEPVRRIHHKEAVKKSSTLTTKAQRHKEKVLSSKFSPPLRLCGEKVLSEFIHSFKPTLAPPATCDAHVAPLTPVTGLHVS